MRHGPVFLFVLLLSACGGPFRPPDFEKHVQLASEGSLCMTSLQGTWPNLPHNPIQWLVGGRSNLLVAIRSPANKGRYEADQISVYYAWPNSAPYQITGLSGYVEFKSNTFVVDLSQSLDKRINEKLEFNGKYSIRNPNDCP